MGNDTHRAKVALLLFVGETEASEVERMVSDACQAAALDTIEKALRLSSLDLILVSTNSRAFAQQVSGLPVQVAIDPPGEPFHFGRRFQSVVSGRGKRRPTDDVRIRTDSKPIKG